jgi:predicted DNA-binding antitoxin AbrB/MazE fold protein
MNQTIRAIYENGVLRPLTPLALPDRTEIQITVESASDRPDVETHRRQVDAALLAAGLMLPRAGSDPTRSSPSVDQARQLPRPLTDAERDALARRIPAGRPLSEIILEERDGR